MTDLYNVVIKGKCIAGLDSEDVKQNLAAIFKAPPEKMERLLSGNPLVVKKNISHEQADRILHSLRKAGAECKIVKQETILPEPLVMEKKETVAPESDVDNNFYKPPESNLVKSSSSNNSGQGKGIDIPDGVKGWSWGAFLLNWIWAIGNKTWIGLFALIPYVGIIMSIALGIKGREWAWQNKHWESIEHFQNVQKRWSFWSVIILVISTVGIAASIIIPIIIDQRPY